MALLSQDSVYDIFSWLPAKAIYKFKCVCKSFSQFSEETTFKTQQTQNSLARDDTCFFIQSDRHQNYERKVELHTLPAAAGEQQQQPSSSSSGVSNNVMRFLSKSVILSSRNGLILCWSTTDKCLPFELFICNPVTQSRSLIPTPEPLQRNPYFNDLNIVLECCNQGNDDDVDDYSVFLFERSIDTLSCQYRCMVYKAKEGMWKTMKRDFFIDDDSSIRLDMSVIHNGTLHFIVDSHLYSSIFRPYILSYNLEDGMSTMLSLPEATRGSHKVGIFKWGKVSRSSSTRSICLVKLKESIFTVWFLKQDHAWQKVLKVGVEAMGLKEEKDPKVTSFMVMNGDLLIFATGNNNKVYSYGLAGDRYMMVEEICQHSCGSKPCFIPYSDTLRPCAASVAAATFSC